MNVRLVIPDLFWPDSPASADDAAAFYADIAVPALERLAAKGRTAQHLATTLESWLADEFDLASDGGLGTELRAAPFTLLADGGNPGEGIWMRADPACVDVARETLLLADTATFPILRDEADSLSDSLSRHFFEDGLRFEAPHPDRWYVRLPELPRMTTTPIASARGRAVEGVLPQGPDAMRWQAVMNEAQMLLHGHPLNALREARGEPAINTVWFWGAGRLAPVRANARLAVYAEDPFARGLAQAAGIAAARLPADAVSFLAQAPEEGVALIVLDLLRPPAAYGQAGAWRERIELLDRIWIAPLVAALAAGRVGMVTIHAPCASMTLHAETTRQDLRRFWRRRRPLARYAV